MLEQWEADNLITAEKVYSIGTTVNLSPGTDVDYPIESVDGTAYFLLDIRRSLRNPNAIRYQLRYRRDIVLARLCVAVPHTNPDGQRVDPPHFHRYREGDADRWASSVEPDTAEALLNAFCREINLPEPDVQGGAL